MPVRHSQASTTLTPARARVLEALQSADRSVTAEVLAAQFGQHVNTVRGHLDFLAEQGLVTRTSVRGAGRGRPAWGYRANPAQPEADSRVREYAALASALARQLARSSPDASADANAAGREWGRELVRSAGLPAGSASAARRAVVGILADLGFDPRPDSRSRTVQLTRCPLLDAARRHPEVVCEVHRGLVAGALDELGGDAKAVALEPFSQPGSCRLALATAGGSR